MNNLNILPHGWHVPEGGTSLRESEGPVCGPITPFVPQGRATQVAQPKPDA